MVWAYEIGCGAEFDLREILGNVCWVLQFSFFLFNKESSFNFLWIYISVVNITNWANDSLGYNCIGGVLPCGLLSG